MKPQDQNPSPRLRDVFISYSSRDRQAAESLCSALEGRAISCWIAPRDILGGEDWAAAITGGIEHSRLLVLVFSAGANASDDVLREVDLATRQKMRVLPLRLDDTQPSDQLRFYLSKAQWLDASTSPLERHLPALGDTIERWLGDRAHAGGEPAPGVPPAPAATAPAEASPAEAAAPGRIALLYKRGASPDEEILHWLETQLTARGHDVFIDRHLAVGVEWAHEIERQVRGADAVIVLLSAASVHSEMLAYEVEVARDEAQHRQGKPRLLPVRIQLTGPLPPPLSALLDPLEYTLWERPADGQPMLDALLHALENPSRATRRPTATSLEMPGGAVPIDSRLYIVRPTDREFLEAITRRDTIVLVKGARQMGKTSLLARGLQQARDLGYQVVLTDFQKLNASHLESLDRLYMALAGLLADQLDLEVFPEDTWNPRRGPNVNFERFLRREVLAKLPSPLVWGLDEVDRLFGHDFGNEVFGLFRSWHNERALDPSGPWSRLTLAIAYATEAHLFINDLNQSPFNVGTRLALEDFMPEEVAELNRRYGSPLAGPEEEARFYRLLGGQPYLVRRGLHELASRGISLAALEQQAPLEEGIFGDHLRRILVLLARDQALLAQVRGLLRGTPLADPASFYRLRSSGVVSGEAPATSRPRCRLYATYLERHLL